MWRQIKNVGLHVSFANVYNFEQNLIGIAVDCPVHSIFFSFVFVWSENCANLRSCFDVTNWLVPGPIKALAVSDPTGIDISRFQVVKTQWKQRKFIFWFPYEDLWFLLCKELSSSANVQPKIEFPFWNLMRMRSSWMIPQVLDLIKRSV